jgi:hypothetical protein
MKPLFTFILVIVAVWGSAQDSTKTFTFKEVGWTVKLPPGFKLMSAAEDAAKNQRGKELMEDVAKTAFDVSELRTLFSATKNTHNYINSTLTPYNPEVDGDWKEATGYVKEILYQTFKEKMPDAVVDTASSFMFIDGIRFDKFRVTIIIDKKVAFNSYLLSKFYKGYDFGISYLALDDKTLRDIEDTLYRSKFKK